MSIPFNIPPATGREPEYLAQAIANRKLCGDGRAFSSDIPVLPASV